MGGVEQTGRPTRWPIPARAPALPEEGRVPEGEAARVILSFDVEEHDRIEAAAGLPLDPGRKVYYRGRVGPATRWLLEELDRHDIKATFFVVGQIARDNAA